MEALKLNESQILKDAWNRYIAGYSKGWSFESAYSHAKAEAHNQAVYLMWKQKADAKRQAAILAENAKIEESGLDLHTYSMVNFYNRNSYNAD